MPATPEDIAWARQAMSDGRSMEFIASVLELSVRKARNAVFGIEERKPRREPQPPKAVREIAEPVEPRRRGRPAAPEGTTELPERRRVMLRRQFARHWAMIWYQRRRGMSGRSLRAIYGAEALIWSVGGGIDAEI